MSFTLGENIRITVAGASHSESIDVTVEGLPEGEKIDIDAINRFLKRRQGGNARYTVDLEMPQKAPNRRSAAFL